MGVRGSCDVALPLLSLLQTLPAQFLSKYKLMSV